jgi:hypothetical protein
MGKAFERNAVLKDVYQTEPFRAIESRKSFHGDRLSDVQAQAVISSSSHIAECIASPRPQLATSSPSLLMHLEVGRVYDLSPSSVLFAHGSISDRFRGNRGMRLDDAINAISNGSLLAGSFPPIGAAQDGGQIISIQGNRRLFVHRVLSTLGVLATIRIKIHSWNDWEMQRLRWDEVLDGILQSGSDLCLRRTAERLFQYVASTDICSQGCIHNLSLFLGWLMEACLSAVQLHHLTGMPE